MALARNTAAGAGTIEAGYLNKSSLCAFLGGTTKPLGKTTINDWIRGRGFPKPIRLSQTLALWRVSEVIQWVETQAAANDGKIMGGVE